MRGTRPLVFTTLMLVGVLGAACTAPETDPFAGGAVSAAQGVPSASPAPAQPGAPAPGDVEVLWRRPIPAPGSAAPPAAPEPLRIAPSPAAPLPPPAPAPSVETPGPSARTSGDLGPPPGTR